MLYEVMRDILLSVRELFLESRVRMIGIVDEGKIPVVKSLRPGQHQLSGRQTGRDSARRGGLQQTAFFVFQTTATEAGIVSSGFHFASISTINRGLLPQSRVQGIPYPLPQQVVAKDGHQDGQPGKSRQPPSYNFV